MDKINSYNNYIIFDLLNVNHYLALLCTCEAKDKSGKVILSGTAILLSDSENIRVEVVNVSVSTLDSLPEVVDSLELFNFSMFETEQTYNYRFILPDIIPIGYQDLDTEGAKNKYYDVIFARMIDEMDETSPIVRVEINNKSIKEIAKNSLVSYSSVEFMDDTQIDKFLSQSEKEFWANENQ